MNDQTDHLGQNEEFLTCTSSDEALEAAADTENRWTFHPFTRVFTPEAGC